MKHKESFPDEDVAGSKQLIDTLTKISEAIISDSYLDDILKFIVTVTAEMIQSNICSLMLVDKAGKELVVKATQSISEEYNTKQNIPIGKGIAGLVAQTGEPLTVLDVRKDKRYISQDIARKANLCSLLSVPLVLKKTVIGVLNCYTPTSHTFNTSEITIIKSIANQAAIVIENFRLVVESKVIKEELESRKIVEKAKKILMTQEDIEEQEAYQRIRKFSMDHRRNIRDVAEAIVLTNEVKQSRSEK
ncbi:GAF domain-containing protein [Candidatus Omnitrophota bacterium]